MDASYKEILKEYKAKIKILEAELKESPFMQNANYNLQGEIDKYKKMKDGLIKKLKENNLY